MYYSKFLKHVYIDKKYYVSFSRFFYIDWIENIDLSYKIIFGR